MATFVNTTQPAQASSDNGMAYIIGAVLIVLLLVVLFVFGRGYFRSGSSPAAPSTTTNTTNITPDNGTGGTGGNTQAAPQVNVPDKIDVNVNHSP